MMAKSTKSLDLHYPMIQFLKIAALHKKTIKKNKTTTYWSISICKYNCFC